uniref:Uncharacterized protein n=1 Tax=Plectus sambesii TaxID=2011161 RepID=A0A914W544_9BILA
MEADRRGQPIASPLMRVVAIRRRLQSRRNRSCWPPISPRSPSRRPGGLAFGCDPLILAATLAHLSTVDLSPRHRLTASYFRRPSGLWACTTVDTPDGSGGREQLSVRPPLTSFVTRCIDRGEQVGPPSSAAPIGGRRVTQFLAVIYDHIYDDHTVLPAAAAPDRDPPSAVETPANARLPGPRAAK